MISVKKLTKIYKSPIKSGNIIKDVFNRQYKSTLALDEISFEIEENELVGFIGPNGAGKTTTMKILSGILYPDNGSINILGYYPFEKNPRFLKQIAFMMGQKNQMLWELPATDTFELNKTIYEIPNTKYNRILHELIELLKAETFINQPVKTLSLGQRMRVELIAALLHEPKVLFLDEPTIGLDIFAQTTIINFIKEYQEKYKATIMLTSHYMKDVERLAKRILMIDKGRILFDGKLQDLIEKYSSDKKIVISLVKPIKTMPAFLKRHHYAYTFPQLTVTVKKNELTDLLPVLLKHVDYEDITIENEEIEDVIKKLFD